MTPDEHEAQRRMVWIEAMKAAYASPAPLKHGAVGTADHVLRTFDARFPAPKSEDEG